ncbi:uncharacterized protein [Miscanthus floridulus]|uniref:uncharacterized protein n=1 Tax=Miscanthus floridulus TaxID=154761 RepID=UPI00345A234C
MANDLMAKSHHECFSAIQKLLADSHASREAANERRRGKRRKKSKSRASAAAKSAIDEDQRKAVGDEDVLEEENVGANSGGAIICVAIGEQEEKLVELDLAKMIFMKKNSMEMDLPKDVIQTMILAKDLKAEMEMAKKVLEKDLKAETEMAKKVLKKNLRKDLKAETEMAKKVLTKNLVQVERAKKMLEKVEILENITSEIGGASRQPQPQPTNPEVETPRKEASDHKEDPLTTSSTGHKVCKSVPLRGGRKKAKAVRAPAGNKRSLTRMKKEQEACRAQHEKYLC